MVLYNNYHYRRSISSSVIPKTNKKGNIVLANEKFKLKLAIDINNSAYQTSDSFELCFWQ
jgi:hypothetical protein